MGEGMNDPWIFGWTQLLTLLGFLITITIAVVGFRTFDRWRREKLEEKRIEVAFEAMALAHESVYIFRNIRSPLSTSSEYADMPRRPDKSDEHWHGRGTYYVILARITQNRDFFERLFKLQPRFMALFGSETEPTFVKCHKARRHIEVSAQMLMRYFDDGGPLNDNAQRQRNQWESDIWEGMDEIHLGSDRVAKWLREFQQEILNLCEPIVRHKGSGRRPTR